MTPSPDDSRIAEFEQRAARAGLSYVKLDGTIGCMANGAGPLMATMDLVASLGGRPAASLDIGESADESLICSATELLLDDGDIRVVWVNAFGATLRCDLVAHALLRVLGERRASIPFVVRLQGTNAAEAQELLTTGPMTLMVEPDLARAARLAVASSGVSAPRRRGSQTQGQ